MKTKLWAFWQYDLFPYVLSGVVSTVRRDKERGHIVEIEGYGKGYWFKPLGIIKGKRGEDMAKALETLKAERRIALSAIDDGYHARIKSLLPFAAKVKYLA